ncbi:hypothetical protein H0H81_004488 [Sphagnurus paluster]|uniref:Uncharacterized protein n=1 Tax=Sphagnurus paluster TaxID=117069 RepID=A0A9P7K291_9AGAR|nr:hypothetical protein H0H81_004488 [Sphagnurus paluster]
MVVNTGPASTARQEGHEPIVAPLAQKLSNNGEKIDFENNCQVNEEASVAELLTSTTQTSGYSEQDGMNTVAGVDPTSHHGGPVAVPPAPNGLPAATTESQNNPSTCDDRAVPETLKGRTVKYPQQPQHRKTKGSPAATSGSHKNASTSNDKADPETIKGRKFKVPHQQKGKPNTADDPAPSMGATAGIVISDGNLIQMPNSDLDWDSGEERKKGKDRGEAEDTTYDKMTDEEREELPGKIEEEIVNYLKKDSKEVPSKYRRLLRKHYFLVPSAATISPCLSVHLLSTERKNFRCLFHENACSGKSSNRVDKTKINPRTQVPQYGDCDCPTADILWDFLLWKVGPRPAVPIAGDVFDKKGWDKTYRRHAIAKTKADTWLNLDDRFIGEKKVTDDGCLPSLEEYEKLMLGRSIPKLLNRYNELGGVVEDILK